MGFFRITGESETVSNTYKCECGHTVHTSSKEPPQSLNWSDGHICILRLIDKGDDDEFSKHSKNS
jgi:hypothetical protein